MFIVGVSGKKQAGKDTLCRGVRKHFITYKSCKIYSFADALKEKVCMEVMGLTREQCYGNDEQKNTLTTYKWDNLPYEMRQKNHRGIEYAPNGEICNYIKPNGFMTAREIMQIIGTDIFREFFDDSIWINATFRDIKKDGHDLALIADVRFPGEIKGIINEGGNILRLSRNICEADDHPSETALDDYDFSTYGSKIHLIDNREMSIKEQEENAIKYIKENVLEKINESMGK